MAKEQKIIIIVDDNEANLTACKKILKPYYTVYPAPSATKMFDLLEHIVPDLIMLDVEMPEIDGYEAARMLKNSNASKGIPIIFLTARNDAISEMEGLNLGALDYIHKPFVSALLLRRLEMHMSLIDFRKTLQTKDELLSRMSISFRTPLNEIVSILDSVKNTGDSGQIMDCFNKVNGISKQLLAQINDLLGSKDI